MSFWEWKYLRAPAGLAEMLSSKIVFRCRRKAILRFKDDVMQESHEALLPHAACFTSLWNILWFSCVPDCLGVNPATEDSTPENGDIQNYTLQFSRLGLV